MLLMFVCTFVYGATLAASRRFALLDADEQTMLNVRTLSSPVDPGRDTSESTGSMISNSSSSLTDMQRYPISGSFELASIPPTTNGSPERALRWITEESSLSRIIPVSLVSLEMISKSGGNSSAFKVASNTHMLGHSIASVVSDHYVIRYFQKLDLLSLNSHGGVEIFTICFMVASCLYFISNTAPCSGHHWWLKKIQETEDRVASLQDSSDKLTADLERLLSQARDSPGYSMQRKFELRQRKFMDFLQQLKTNPEHALWASGEPALLAQLQLFTGIWLEFSEAFSLGSEFGPLRSVYTADLFRCNTVHGVSDLVSHQLKAFEIAKGTEMRIKEAQEVLNGKKDMVGHKLSQKTRPKFNAASYSCRSLLLVGCIFLGMCIVSFEIALGNNCYATGVFVSSVCLLLSISQGACRDQLMWILEEERQLELHVGLLSCRYTELREQFDQIEGAVNVWEHLLEPCLSILAELHTLLLDDPPEQALTFLWGVNQKLRKLRHDLDVEAIKNPSSLVWDVARQVGIQLRNCSRFIKESRDCTTSQLQPAAQTFQILLKLTALIRVMAVRVIAGYDLVNIGGTNGSSFPMLKRLKTKTPDPYTRLRLGATGWVKTSVCKHNSNPEWDSDVFLFVASSLDHQLEMEVLDDKNDFQDGVLGQLVVAVEETQMLLQRSDVETLDAGRWHRRRVPMASVQQQQGELEFEVYLACNFSQLDLLAKSM